jgi:serine/threonine protein kinase
LEAQNFVAALLETDPKRRMSASEALKQSWVRDVEESKATGKDLCRLPSKESKTILLASVSTQVVADAWSTDFSSSNPHRSKTGAFTTETTEPEKPQPAGSKSFWRFPPLPSVLQRSRRRVSAFFAAVRRTRTGNLVAPARQVVPFTQVMPLTPTVRTAPVVQ